MQFIVHLNDGSQRVIAADDLKLGGEVLVAVKKGLETPIKELPSHKVFKIKPVKNKKKLPANYGG